MRFTDAAHLGLMLAALGLSYLVPFELLLLSYVVLGPAHYTTEISWLHDRKYFLPQRGIAAALALVAIMAALIDNASWFGFTLWAAFVVCALLTATTTALQGMVLIIAALAVTAALVILAAALSGGTSNRTEPCSTWISRADAFKLKTVFSPSRVIVRSANVNSARD